MTYQEAANAPAELALTLGVAGNTSDCNNRRLTAAQDVLATRQRLAERAYATDSSLVDPAPAKPFGIDKVIAAGGNLQAVVDDPELVEEILADWEGQLFDTRMDAMAHGGEAPAWVSPPDRSTAIEEAHRIRTVLANEGHLEAHHPPSADSTPDTTAAAAVAQHELHPSRPNYDEPTLA